MANHFVRRQIVSPFHAIRGLLSKRRQRARWRQISDQASLERAFGPYSPLGTRTQSVSNGGNDTPPLPGPTRSGRKGRSRKNDEHQRRAQYATLVPLSSCWRTPLRGPQQKREFIQSQRFVREPAATLASTNGCFKIDRSDAVPLVWLSQLDLPFLGHDRLFDRGGAIPLRWSVCEKSISRRMVSLRSIGICRVATRHPSLVLSCGPPLERAPLSQPHGDRPVPCKPRGRAGWRGP